MKKLTVILVAVAAIVVFACSAKKEGPVAELTDYIEKYIGKLEKANSATEIEALAEELEQTMSDFEKKYPDFKPTPEEEAELKELMEKGQKAAMDAAQRYINDLGDKVNP